MYARMTLLEIDTLRISVRDALKLFREQVVPAVALDHNQFAQLDALEGREAEVAA
jgi:hypothetical protein